MRHAAPRTLRLVASTLLVATLGLGPDRAHAGEPMAEWLPIPLEQASLGNAPFVVDAVGRRAYYVGGLHDGTPTDRVYESDLDAPKVDWRAVNWGPGPEPRTRAKTVLDPSGRRLFYVGGATEYGYPWRDVWRSDLAAGSWSRLQVGFNGLSLGRVDRDEPMLLDTRRERLYVLQGRGTSASVFYCFDLAARVWTQPLPANAPAFGAGAFAAYDSLADRILLLGGASVGGANPGLLRVLDLATMTWGVSAAPPCPLPVHLSKAGFDPVARRIVVAHATLADQWATLDVDAPTSWVSTTAQTGPLAVWAFDPVRGEMHATNGTVRGDRLTLVGTRDAFSYSLRVPLHAVAPAVAGGPAHALDPVTDAWYLHGGNGASAADCSWGPNPCALDAVWRLPLTGPARFEPVEVAGEGPGPLRFHSAVLDSVGRRLVFHGGVDAAGVIRGDTWALTLDGTPTWSRIATTPDGPAIAEHVATIDASRRWMYVVGGTLPTTHNLEVWKLDLSTSPATWSSLGVTMPPLAPRQAVVGFDAQAARLLVVAGYGTQAPFAQAAVQVDLDPPAVRTFTPRYRFNMYQAYDSARRRIVSSAGWIDCNCHSRYIFMPETATFSGDPSPGFMALATSGQVPTHQVPLAIYDRMRDRMLVLGSVLHELRFDSSTPARMDLVEATPGDGGIRVRFAGEGWTGDVTVERTEEAIDGWERIGTAVEITPGTVEFVDRSAAPGVSYLYRGRFTDETGERVTSPSTAVSMPAASATLALRARDGVVGRGWPVVFECRVPGTQPARLELYDVAGRVVARATAAGSSGEWRSVSLAPSRGGAGLYFARLLQGDDLVRTRIVRL